MKNLRLQKGFSLMETIVSTAILTILVTAIYAALFVGNKSWVNNEANIKAQQEVRKGLVMMTKDLRVAKSVITTQNSLSFSLSFTHPNDGALTYSWASTGGSAQQLIRQTATKTRIIAQNISAISLTETATNFTVNLTATVPNANGKTNVFQLAKSVTKR